MKVYALYGCCAVVYLSSRTCVKAKIIFDATNDLFLQFMIITDALELRCGGYHDSRMSFLTY